MAGAAIDAGEAARLLGVCERTFRRYVDRYEDEGLDGLVDRWRPDRAARPDGRMRPAIVDPLSLAYLAAALTIAATHGSAQTNTIEEVVVTAATGSRIVRQGDSPSPLSSYDGQTLLDSGLKDIRDLVGVLSINAGAENNSDNLTQNYTVGTANINLRGLGVASTLVLLNGRRQVLSSAQTDDGSSFVDLAGLVPMLAVERVEILKDGAAAIYGSEAVAGVANFITRRGFRGIELQAEYRSRVGDGSQDDLTLDGVVGGEFGSNGEFLVAASYLDRSSLVLIEVDWLRPATSGFGNPGSFNVPSAGRTFADPDCEQYEGLLQALPGDSTICRFDYGPQLTAIPNEKRLQTWGRVDWDSGDAGNFWAELGYASNDINRDVSPSFPVLSTPIIPAYHPGNPFGEDVYFQGRPYGSGQPPEVNFYEHDTARLAAGFEGRFTDTASWNISLVRAQNDALLNPRDVIAANFQAALLGFGGGDCSANPLDAEPGQAGTGGCLFFNPFSSNFAARPGETLHNSPALRPFIIGDYFGDGRSQLTTLEANVTGFLPWRDAGYAAGVQYRDQSVDFFYDDITRQDGFAFLIGNPDFDARDQVRAAYGEVWLPISESVEITGALRYEDYGEGVGDTLDPKVTLLYRVTDGVSIRGSYSTSFRAPSPFQTRGVQTNFTNIVDHDGSRTFAGRRTLGDPNLRPETSSAFNAGISWQNTGNWAFNADYWRYSFEDVLRKENAQAIVNADPLRPAHRTHVRGHDCHRQRRLHQRRPHRNLRYRRVCERDAGHPRRISRCLGGSDVAARVRRDQRGRGRGRARQTQPRQPRCPESALQGSRRRQLVQRRRTDHGTATARGWLRGRRRWIDRRLHHSGRERSLVTRRASGRAPRRFHHAGRCQPAE